jgi:hypothetical protein
MKFEASRVIQTVEQLGEPQFKGPDGLARLLDFVAEGFHAFHWQTERLEARGLLIARPAAEHSAGQRVVFLVPLGAVQLKDFPRVRLFRRRSQSSPASSEAERAGPAFLLELARSWPASRSERLEAICVTAGVQRKGHAGAREVLRMIQREWEQKPTLLVSVRGPGIGQKIVIQARRSRQIAVTAALDLWIPHRTITTNPFSALVFHWPFQKNLDDYVALFGGGYLEGKETQIERAALDRTAQLCTEISLRWARQQLYKPGSPEEDRTASRSLQNPG